MELVLSLAIGVLAAAGVWLVLHKKGGAVTELDYEAALQEALCFGWIDGQGRRRDEDSSFQRMTRRGPKSVWSARNVERIGRLESAGRIAPAGRAAVDSAKADGRWEAAYSGAAAAEAPADLAAAIAAEPRARERGLAAVAAAARARGGSAGCGRG